MEFRAHPDGSVTVEEGIARMTWPTMDDFLSAQAPLGGATANERAVLYGAALMEDARAARLDPKDPANLETISRTKEPIR